MNSFFFLPEFQSSPNLSLNKNRNKITFIHLGSSRLCKLVEKVLADYRWLIDIKCRHTIVVIRILHFGLFHLTQWIFILLYVCDFVKVASAT